jgi:hypothetical protein
MKVGIMQPYFFPYIGYFQLIHAVDTYVNLDHVSFMKRSYMTRNSIKNDISLNLQVKNASQNRSCREVYVDFNHNYISKFRKTIELNYSKSPFYGSVIEQIIEPHFVENEICVSDFNFGIIKSICGYLNIGSTFIETSTQFAEVGKKADGLIDITRSIGADSYVNAIGGTKLYDKPSFKEKGVDLYFIKMDKIDLEDEYRSILHHLFLYDPNHIRQQMNKYTLL